MKKLILKTVTVLTLTASIFGSIPHVSNAAVADRAVEGEAHLLVSPTKWVKVTKKYYGRDADIPKTIFDCSWDEYCGDFDLTKIEWIEDDPAYSDHWLATYEGYGTQF
ncbi:hypothetical protein [Cytobacillus sp. IB215665]|uniref:hypothetical protein n=1 Tax=Cytobacillus sp. IB215665 TaxID=3097357 RepID=UPI002A0FA952|nr:hypothetical protein [Cytobacillus sp. IB215665]MDX8365159.1 hypothetical protein [Cytobacillus sp. IB215665]